MDEECMDRLHGTKKFCFHAIFMIANGDSIGGRHFHNQEQWARAWQWRKEEGIACVIQRNLLGPFPPGKQRSDCSIDRDERARCKDCITIKASTDAQGCTNRANRM